MTNLRDHLFALLTENTDGCVVNGPTGSARLPGNVHVSFPGCEGDSLLMIARRERYRVFQWFGLYCRRGPGVSCADRDGCVHCAGPQFAAILTGALDDPR